MEEAIKGKIQKLQLIEENLHSYLGQKQQVQSQLMEIESATAALDSAKSSYKIIGNIMVEQSEADLRKELGERLERVKVRLAALERQEERLKEQAESLQQEIMKSMKGDSHGEL
jgi:prefoldin beta subunit